MANIIPSEVMREHFPFMKDGDINPELMSFAKLYLDEIVEKVLAKYDDPIIGTFLEALGVSIESIQCNSQSFRCQGRSINEG